DQGRVQQVASPLQIYREPANAFVADFIGTSNLLAGTLEDGVVIRALGQRLRPERVPAELASAGARVVVSVRPEEVHVHPAGRTGANCLPGQVRFVRDLGASVEIRVACADSEVLAVVTPRERPPVQAGDQVVVELPADAMVVLPA